MLEERHVLIEKSIALIVTTCPYIIWPNFSYSGENAGSDCIVGRSNYFPVWGTYQGCDSHGSHGSHGSHTTRSTARARLDSATTWLMHDRL
jgi:hypothetical protein